jgi:hypothetical protein
MSKKAIIPLAILAAPYAYLAYFWVSCFSTRCSFDPNMILCTLVAVIALPVVMLITGVGFAAGGVRRLRAAKAEATSGQGGGEGRGSGVAGLSIGLWLLAGAIPGCLGLLYIALDTPPPGRDRLGRICEKTNSGEVCRPDPEADHPTTLEMANRQLRRQREQR